MTDLLSSNSASVVPGCSKLLASPVKTFLIYYSGSDASSELPLFSVAWVCAASCRIVYYSIFVSSICEMALTALCYELILCSSATSGWASSF